MEPQCNQRLVDQKFRDLSRRFQVEDKTSSMYGIPEPNEHLTEIDIERSKCNAWNSRSFTTVNMTTLQIQMSNDTYLMKSLITSFYKELRDCALFK